MEALWLIQQRIRKTPILLPYTVPTKLSSRLEDLKKDLKVGKLKNNSILPVLEKALSIPKEKALEKERINFQVPFNTRLPDYGAIFRQNWSHMISKYPELKNVMPAPPGIC